MPKRPGKQGVFCYTGRITKPAGGFGAGINQNRFMNLWHDVTLGDNVPEEFNTIIEIPHGSHNKYEIDKETGLIALDRANYSDAPYPVNYGFAPKTLWEDGDAIDVLVMTTWPLDVGVLVKVRPVALLEMYDEDESDFKIIAVPAADKRWDDTNDLKDLNKHRLKELTHFFETYKMLKADGYESKVKADVFSDKAAAQKALQKSIELYKEKFNS